MSPPARESLPDYRAGRAYKCGICQGEFATQEELREHLKQGHIR